MNKQRVINEVFIDTKNFNPPKRLKCVEDDTMLDICKEYCIFGKMDCSSQELECRSMMRDDEMCVYFIETTEPITEQSTRTTMAHKSKRR